MATDRSTDPVLPVAATMLQSMQRRAASWSDEHSEASTRVGMTLPEMAAAYARIDMVWRSATRRSKQVYLVQLVQLDAAVVAHFDVQRPEVRDLVRGIRLLRKRIELAMEPPAS